MDKLNNGYHFLQINLFYFFVTMLMCNRHLKHLPELMADIMTKK